MANNDTGPFPAVDKKVKQLDSVATAIFFVWIGVAVLAKIGLTWSFFGVGVILLGQQAAQSRLNTKVDGFKIVCGAVFLLGAVWELFGVNWPLLPVLLILIGIGGLWKAISGSG